jgi:hypothetical protein
MRRRQRACGLPRPARLCCGRPSREGKAGRPGGARARITRGTVLAPPPKAAPWGAGARYRKPGAWLLSLLRGMVHYACPCRPCRPREGVAPPGRHRNRNTSVTTLPARARPTGRDWWRVPPAVSDADVLPGGVEVAGPGAARLRDDGAAEPAHVALLEGAVFNPRGEAVLELPPRAPSPRTGSGCGCGFAPRIRRPRLPGSRRRGPASAAGGVGRIIDYSRRTGRGTGYPAPLPGRGRAPVRQVGVAQPAGVHRAGRAGRVLRPGGGQLHGKSFPHHHLGGGGWNWGQQAPVRGAVTPGRVGRYGAGQVVRGAGARPVPAR